MQEDLYELLEAVEEVLDLIEYILREVMTVNENASDVTANLLTAPTLVGDFNTLDDNLMECVLATAFDSIIENECGIRNNSVALRKVNGKNYMSNL